MEIFLGFYLHNQWTWAIEIRGIIFCSISDAFFYDHVSQIVSSLKFWGNTSNWDFVKFEKFIKKRIDSAHQYATLLSALVFPVLFRWIDPFKSLLWGKNHHFQEYLEHKLSYKLEIRVRHEGSTAERNYEIAIELNFFKRVQFLWVTRAHFSLSTISSYFHTFFVEFLQKFSPHKSI